MNLTSRLRKSSVLPVVCSVLTVQSFLSPLAYAASGEAAAAAHTSQAEVTRRQAASASRSGGAPQATSYDVLDGAPQGTSGLQLAGGYGDSTFTQAASPTGGSAWANGLASVDPSRGAAVASLPIELPHARGRISPRLDVRYDSSAGDLEAGVGWSLDLPTITRIGPTGLVRPIYSDPNIGGRVTLNTDRFAYNGSALVPICLIEASGCTTNAGSAYEGPMPSFTSGGGWHYYRLQAENGETLRFFWSPDHLTWVIQSKNGNIEELGIPLDRNYDATNGVDLELLQGAGPGGYPPPTAPFRWNLVRQYDANRLAKSHVPANPIIYAWNGTGKRHTLSDVYYSGPLTPWPALGQYVHHVHFSYDEHYGTYAPQNSPTWRARSLSTISEIDVTSANVTPATDSTRYLDRRYHLTQTADHDHFLLTSFQLEGRCASPVAELASGLLPATNCQTLPATTLSYSPSAPQSAPIAQTIPGTGTPGQFTNRTTYPIDLNNDGLPDLISAPPVDPCVSYLYECLSAGGSTFQQCFYNEGCNAPTQDLYLNGASGQVASLTKSTINVELGDGWTDARQDNIVPGASWNTFLFAEGYLTPNVRAFSGDFYGDGRSNLMMFDAQIALDGRNGCDFQPSNQWNGLNYVFSAQSTPSEPWSLNVQNVETYVLPNTLEFAWLGSADFDGDGYTDRMTWRKFWQQPISPAVCYSQNDVPNGPEVVGVELTQRSAAGIVDPFSVGTVPPGQTETQTYTANVTAACNDTFAPWMFATHENLQQAYDAYEDGTPNPVNPAFWIQDMDGDALPDIVMYQYGTPGFAFYPGHGDGYFGVGVCQGNSTSGAVCACEQANQLGVEMANSPAVTASGVSKVPYYVHDVNGDGLADIIQASSGINVYFNTDGSAFTNAMTLAPTASDFDATKSHLTFADVNGNGVDDVVVITDSTVQYFDLSAAGDRPYLLTTIDNGLGGSTSISYDSVAHLMTVASPPWEHVSPQSVAVVTEIETKNGLSDSSSTATHHAVDQIRTFAYRDPIYDFHLQAFRGFLSTYSTIVGDDAAPNQTTEVDFAIQATPQSYFDVDNTYADVQSLPVVIEHWSGPATVDGKSQSTQSLTHNQYLFEANATGMDGRSVHIATVEQSDTWLWDVPNQSTKNVAAIDVDAPTYPNGATRILQVPADATSPHLRTANTISGLGNNLNERWDYGIVDGGAVDTPILYQYNWEEQGDPGDWIWQPTTTVTGYTNGGQTRAYNYVYDDGGNLTDLSGTLLGTLPIERRTDLPGGMTAPVPSTISHDGSVELVHRVIDPVGSGNATMINRPGEGCISYAYDGPSQSYLTRSTVYAGLANGNTGCGSQPLATSVTYDAGIEQVTSSIDPNGAMSSMKYDTFGRLIAAYAPNPSVPFAPNALPAMTRSYFVEAATPTRIETTVLQTDDFVPNGDPPAGSYITMWQYLDALGNDLVTLQQADPGAGDAGQWVVSGVTDVSANGFVLDAHQPEFYNGDASQYDVNRALQLPAQSYQYDRFARLAGVTGYDGLPQGGVTYAALTKVVSDADNLDPSSAHLGKAATIQMDGHGRIVSVSQPNLAGVETTSYSYLATGELTTLQRAGGYVHAAIYDTLGRLVENDEPNSMDAAATLHTWRYAYDDASRLVATSDARGCGKNISYDTAGRPIAVDYSPCLSLQTPYSDGDAITGTGTEAFYRYDTPEAGDSWPIGSIGRLTAISDRGAHSRLHYDLRGRVVSQQKQLAVPRGEAISNLAARFAPHWYTSTAGYDELGEVVSRSTGIDLSELQGVNGKSVVQTSYSLRGLPTSVEGSYGTLVGGINYGANALPSQITYGDARSTRVSLTYDSLWRVHERKVAPTSGPPLFQTDLIEDTLFSYDELGNPTEIDDLRDPGLWPTGAKPVSWRGITYDDKYRLLGVEYDSSGDRFVPPDTGLQNALPDTQPSSTPPTRVKSQTYEYDILGNAHASLDDSDVFFDRSLGTVQNAPNKNQLISASDGTDFVDAHYDGAGNVVDVTLQRTRGCTAATDTCTHRFTYVWDEVNRLTYAARWDFAGQYSASLPQYPALPTSAPGVVLRMTYDAMGNRVLKAVSPEGNTADTLYSATVFPSLRLDDTTFDGTDYARTPSTESAYFLSGASALGRLVYDETGTLPTTGGDRQHVFLEITDERGSTSAVIDRGTGVLVERSTYQAYGGADSDYRPAAWKYWEPYRFAGKEADAELGLTYFGQRYYSANLGRWMSPDPLAVHSFRSDPNPYAYVGGRVLSFVDPDGLDGHYNEDGVLIFDDDPLRARPPSDDEGANPYEQSKPTDARTDFNPPPETQYWEQTPEEATLPYAGTFDDDFGLFETQARYVPIATTKDDEIQDEVRQGHTTIANNMRAHQREAVFFGVIGWFADLVLPEEGAVVDLVDVGLSGVQANRAAGNAFRDEIAGTLRNAGRDVDTEVYKATPFGRRFIDLEVSQDGDILGGVETKLGNSRYTPAQRAKDIWLLLTQGYRVNVVRRP